MIWCTPAYCTGLPCPVERFIPRVRSVGFLLCWTEAHDFMEAFIKLVDPGNGAMAIDEASKTNPERFPNPNLIRWELPIEDVNQDWTLSPGLKTSRSRGLKVAIHSGHAVPSIPKCPCRHLRNSGVIRLPICS